MSVLGTRVVRREDPALVTGQASFVADVPLDGAQHVVFVRSTVAHARIVSIDTSEADAMPGVSAVLTGETLTMPPRPPALPTIDVVFSRPGLARDVVRFVGEPVALVVADSVARATDAAEAVWVEYEPLPVSLDPMSSATSSQHLFPDAGTNVIAAIPPNRDDDVVAGADIVVRRRIVNHRMAPAPMEPRVIAASWDGQRMTVHASTQGAFGLRNIIAGLLEVAPDCVRVRYQDVGGGFGAKGLPHVEELVVVWLARELDRPVRWAETRTENLLAMGHARAQVHDMTIGARSDGRIVGLDISLTQDGGAYPHVATFLPRLTLMMAPGVYDIPEIRLQSQVVATNTNPVGAFRGAGRPEAAYAIERLMDELAVELDLDPAELRRRNFIPPERFPLETAAGARYDSGDYAVALARVLDTLDYRGLWQEQVRRREAGETRLLGIGLATYVEVTNVTPGADTVDISLEPGGRVTLRTGSAPQGQGHVTTWAMIAAEELGVAMDDVDVIMGDTDVVPPGAGVGASRSVQSLGSAVSDASKELIAVAREAAANLLEAAVHDVVVDPAQGVFHVAGTPALSVSWADIAAANDESLAISYEHSGREPTFPFGAHAAVVEVDAETGDVGIVRFVALDDCGRVLNPLLADGQVHGGIASGIGQALFEEIVYDEQGTPLISNFAFYGFPSAAELPSFELIDMETPTPNNPLGAKGIGESGTIGAMPAVANAVIDALSHLGVRHLDTPLTPQRVWSAIRGASS